MDAVVEWAGTKGISRRRPATFEEDRRGHGPVWLWANQTAFQTDRITDELVDLAIELYERGWRDGATAQRQAGADVLTPPPPSKLGRDNSCAWAIISGEFIGDEPVGIGARGRARPRRMGD